MTDAGPSMQEPPEKPGRVGVAPPGYRLPPETRVGHVTLQVADLDRSVAYYRDVIGLRELGGRRERARLGLEDGTTLVELVQHPGAAPVPRTGRLGLYHFALLLPDRTALGAFLRHLAERGIRPGMSDHSVSEALYLTDPDGLGIEIYADRPRSAWSHNGRELHITTEPLDVHDLLDAGAQEVWTGMPVGSVVGHVHLFVGDLEAAAAFYHRALGLDRMVWSYPGALFLAAGGYHHHLGTNTWAATAAAAGPGDARLLEWRLVLPTPESVREAGESVHAAGYAVEWGEGNWTAADPWGTRVRVVGGEDS